MLGNQLLFLFSNSLNFWLYIHCNWFSYFRYNLFFDPVLYLYALIGNVLVYKSLWAIQTYVWGRYNINYKYLLDIKDKQVPEFLNVLFYSSIELNMLLVSIIFYISSRRGDGSPHKFGGLYFLSFLPSYFFPLSLFAFFFSKNIWNS